MENRSIRLGQGLKRMTNYHFRIPPLTSLEEREMEHD
jgi:hypothetical protein